ncbi:MAG TPA: efflux RND transporter periplasmic adaptor subunit [Aquabacterium sp.]|nr:efflux RND transporter periplasmic adaptor subunit [Aquabacterium sp.]
MEWRAVTVDATEAVTQPLLRTLQFSARVETPARVEVGTTITGRVARVLVREGDAVAAGAPLVQLESDEARANLAQAQANLAQAQGRLSSQQGLALPNAQAAQAQAQAQVLAAERDLIRVRELVAAQFYSPARLDESQRTLDVARAQRDAARAQVQANAAQGGERVGAQAQLDAARAAVAVAQARLDQTTVRAPAAGQVLDRKVEAGQIVQAGTALMGLSVQGPIEIVAQVDERFLGQLAPGQKAQVLADAFPSQPFAAHIDRLAPAVDAERGAVEVTLVVDGPRPAFLREDMTLSVEVVTGRRASARVLPLRALRPGATDQQATVLVIEDGVARERALRLGLRNLEQVEVTSGLQDGDAVVLDANVAPNLRVRARLVPSGVTSQGAPTGTSQDRAGPAISGGFGR